MEHVAYSVKATVRAMVRMGVMVMRSASYQNRNAARLCWAAGVACATVAAVHGVTAAWLGWVAAPVVLAQVDRGRRPGNGWWVPALVGTGLAVGWQSSWQWVAAGLVWWSACWSFIPVKQSATQQVGRLAFSGVSRNHVPVGRHGGDDLVSTDDTVGGGYHFGVGDGGLRIG